jgi:hypothetical protein
MKTIDDIPGIEKRIAINLESSMNRRDLQTAKINMDFYYDHIKKYGATNLQRYCNLKNRYLRMKGVVLLE